MTAARRRAGAETFEFDPLEVASSRAARADAGEFDLARDMGRISETGLLGQLCDDAVASHIKTTQFRRLGRANLSLGRLAEGHVNAIKLIQLYGTPAQRQKHRLAAENGTIYGVWGADNVTPVEVMEPGSAGLKLSGGKRFASGLGIVGYAVVTAQTPHGTQLVIAKVERGPREDASSWRMSGMRATASGCYDFTDQWAEPLGKPGDYEREPHFQGGIWRYAALHVGGLEVLADEVRKAVAVEDDAASEAQLHRVARLATLAHGARLMVESAAVQVELPEAGADEVALVLAAREAVETSCLEAIAIADRALGTRSFTEGDTVERVRRDLAVFLRQADLDGKLRLAGETLCRSDRVVGEIWGKA